MNTSGIRNIIFDFGGVIINIDFQKTIESFIRLGAGKFDQLYSKASQSGLFDELDKGNITSEVFIGSVLTMLPEGVTPQEVVQAWNDILIGIPRKRINLLKEIKNNYQTFLLSNTNEIHYKLYNEWLKDQGSPDFSGLFDGVYLSFKLGLRKPEPAIFDLVFAENNISKKETLFIDDSLHIIEKARALGIPSYWLQDGQDICQLFKDGKFISDLESIL